MPRVNSGLLSQGKTYVDTAYCANERTLPNCRVVMRSEPIERPIILYTAAAAAVAVQSPVAQPGFYFGQGTQ